MKTNHKWIISFCLIGFLILTGCDSKTINFDTFKLKEDSSNSFLCESWAKQLSPEKVYLVRSGYVADYILRSESLTDGKINNEREIYYNQGRTEGQNVNYFYPSYMLDLYRSPSYSEQVIDDAGNILGTNSIEVDYILKLINGSTVNTKINGFDVTLTGFSIEKMNIVSCKIYKLK